MARLRSKVDAQAEKLRQKDETIRALMERLRRYEAAKEQNNNIIRDEICDDNDNMIHDLIQSLCIP